MPKPPINVSPEALRHFEKKGPTSQADLKVVKSTRKEGLPDTPSDRLPRSTEVSLELALDVLLNHYVRERDWFMAERLAHDLQRLHDSQAKISS